MTVAAIRTSAQVVASRGLRDDLSHEYFLLTPTHVETCFSGDRMRTISR
jgi:hypothetical protein